MTSIIRSIVFQPPDASATVEHSTLMTRRERMRTVTKTNGDLVFYLEVVPPTVRSELVILYSHGNAEHLGSCVRLLEWISGGLGMVIVAYDYCGYGFSGPIGSRPGSNSAEVSEKSVYEDADAMYAEVTRKYTERNVVLMGRSVGGGPSCYLARQHHDRIAGLILQSTFTSCFGVVDLGALGCSFLSCCCKCLDLFPNEKNLAETLACPIFIMHGTADTVVPHKCSLKLLETVTKTRQRYYDRESKQHPAPTAAVPPADSPDEPAASDHDISVSVTDSEVLLLPVGRKYHRVFPRGAAETNNTTEAQLGVFSCFFDMCGHNDIEMMDADVFAREMTRFLRFCALVRNDPGNVE